MGPSIDNLTDGGGEEEEEEEGGEGEGALFTEPRLTSLADFLLLTSLVTIPPPKPTQCNFGIRTPRSSDPVYPYIYLSIQY